MNAIARSLEANGCWPPYTSDPHPHQPLVNDNVENGDSDIYTPKAGTSQQVVTEQPQSSSESLNLPPPMKKGKGKGKKSRKLEVEEDPYDTRHIARADNSKFSIGDSGDEIDLKDDNKEKVGKNPFESDYDDEEEKGDFYIDN